MPLDIKKKKKGKGIINTQFTVVTSEKEKELPQGRGTQGLKWTNEVLFFKLGSKFAGVFILYPYIDVTYKYLLC